MRKGSNSRSLPTQERKRLKSKWIWTRLGLPLEVARVRDRIPRKVKVGTKTSLKCFSLVPVTLFLVKGKAANLKEGKLFRLKTFWSKEICPKNWIIQEKKLCTMEKNPQNRHPEIYCLLSVEVFQRLKNLNTMTILRGCSILAVRGRFLQQP